MIYSNKEPVEIFIFGRWFASTIDDTHQPHDGYVLVNGINGMPGPFAYPFAYPVSLVRKVSNDKS